MAAFECRMCGECCYGEGGIFLEEGEEERVARFLSISPEDFRDRFCEERNGRVYLTTGEDHFCIFHERGKGCLIHPVKPSRCALWPYYPANVSDEGTWEMAKLACRGIDREGSFEEFVKEAHSVARETRGLNRKIR